jgi:hypothetical protein
MDDNDWNKYGEINYCCSNSDDHWDECEGIVALHGCYS